METKRKRLEAAGWKVGDAKDFLQLSPEEAAYIDFKIALSAKIKQIRLDKNMTQFQFATVLKTSQSRIAKMENGDPSVSTDLLIRGLLALGGNTRKLIRALAD